MKRTMIATVLVANVACGELRAPQMAGPSVVSSVEKSADTRDTRTFCGDLEFNVTVVKRALSCVRLTAQTKVPMQTWHVLTGPAGDEGFTILGDDAARYCGPSGSYHVVVIAYGEAGCTHVRFIL